MYNTTDYRYWKLMTYVERRSCPCIVTGSYAHINYTQYLQIITLDLNDSVV